MHDSHIFDGSTNGSSPGAVLAAEVADAEGLQYIVTMNSDGLERTKGAGFAAERYVLATRLTDPTRRRACSVQVLMSAPTRPGGMPVSATDPVRRCGTNNPHARRKPA